MDLNLFGWLESTEVYPTNHRSEMFIPLQREDRGKETSNT